MQGDSHVGYTKDYRRCFQLFKSDAKTRPNSVVILFVQLHGPN